MPWTLRRGTPSIYGTPIQVGRVYRQTSTRHAAECQALASSRQDCIDADPWPPISDTAGLALARGKRRLSSACSHRSRHRVARHTSAATNRKTFPRCKNMLDPFAPLGLPARVRIGEHLGRQRVRPSASSSCEGEQTRIGGDPRSAKLNHAPEGGIEPENLAMRFPPASPWPPRSTTRNMLIIIAELLQPRGK